MVSKTAGGFVELMEVLKVDLMVDLLVARLVGETDFSRVAEMAA